MKRTGTVQFNVGGKLYTVSRSLLDNHDTSMLARSASEQWQEDPESEIFIERDGTIFRFVLDFMRNGEVFLPITESKESLLKELEYYGIDVVDESLISDAILRKNTCITTLRKAVGDLRETCIKYEAELEKQKVSLQDAEFKYRSSIYALDVLTAYVYKSKDNFDKTDVIKFNFDNESEEKDNYVELCNLERDDEVKEMVDNLLEFVGLKLESFKSSVFDASVKLIDNSASKKLRKVEFADQ